MKQHDLNRSLLKLRSTEALLSKYYDSSHTVPILSSAVRTQTAQSAFFGGILNNRNDPKTRKGRSMPITKQQTLPATQRTQLSPLQSPASSPEPLFAELLLGPYKPTTPKPQQLVHRKAPLRPAHLCAFSPSEPQMYLGPLTLSSRPICRTGSGKCKSDASLLLDRLVRGQANRRYIHTRSTARISKAERRFVDTWKEEGFKRTAEICLPVVHAISSS